MKIILIFLLLISLIAYQSNAESYGDRQKKVVGIFLISTSVIEILAGVFSGRYKLIYTDEVDPMPIPWNAEVYSNSTGSIIYQRQPVKWLIFAGAFSGAIGLHISR